LNKQIKERRVLYLVINFDGSRAAPGEEEDEKAQRIRVKIKSGQTADYLASSLITK